MLCMVLVLLVLVRVLRLLWKSGPAARRIIVPTRHTHKISVYFSSRECLVLILFFCGWTPQPVLLAAAVRGTATSGIQLRRSDEPVVNMMHRRAHPSTCIVSSLLLVVLAVLLSMVGLMLLLLVMMELGLIASHGRRR